MIQISDKVINFAEKRDFIGIVLKQEITKFG